MKNCFLSLVSQVTFRALFCFPLCRIMVKAIKKLCGTMMEEINNNYITIVNYCEQNESFDISTIKQSAKAFFT